MTAPALLEEISLASVNYNDFSKVVDAHHVNATGHNVVPLLPKDAQTFNEANLLALAEKNALDEGITGLVPLKVVKSAGPFEGTDGPDVNPFHDSYSDVTETEGFQFGTFKFLAKELTPNITGDDEINLVICWKIAGSDDSEGQIRGRLQRPPRADLPDADDADDPEGGKSPLNEGSPLKEEHGPLTLKVDVLPLSCQE